MMTRLIALVLLLLAGCSATERTDVPVSRENAKNIVPVPLPVSASNVFYVLHAGGMQELELYVRFDCAPDQVNEWVDSATKSNNVQFSRALPYQHVSLSVASRAVEPDRSLAPIQWWTPSAIKAGYYCGAFASQALRLWVDTDKSRVYLNMTD